MKKTTIKMNQESLAFGLKDDMIGFLLQESYKAMSKYDPYYEEARNSIAYSMFKCLTTMQDIVCEENTIFEDKEEDCFTFFVVLRQNEDELNEYFVITKNDLELSDFENPVYLVTYLKDEHWVVDKMSINYSSITTKFVFE